MRDKPCSLDFICGGAHEVAELEVPVVQPNRCRCPVVAADAALRADDKHIAAREVIGIPPHARIDRHTEDIAARRRAQHLIRQRQSPLWPRFPRADIVQPRRRSSIKFLHRHRCSTFQRLH